MKINPLLYCVMTLLLSVIAHAETLYTVDIDVWDRPQDGQAVASMQPLPDVIKDWAAQPDAIIEIRYPGGEMGELWARQMQDWLIALGVPSYVLQLMPGSAAIDRMELAVLQKKED